MQLLLLLLLSAVTQRYYASFTHTHTHTSVFTKQQSLRAGIPPRHVTSHPGQLSLLAGVGRCCTATGNRKQNGSFYSLISVSVAGKTV